MNEKGQVVPEIYPMEDIGHKYDRYTNCDGSEPRLSDSGARDITAPPPQYTDTELSPRGGEYVRVHQPGHATPQRYDDRMHVRERYDDRQDQSRGTSVEPVRADLPVNEQPRAGGHPEHPIHTQSQWMPESGVQIPRYVLQIPPWMSYLERLSSVKIEIDRQSVSWRSSRIKLCISDNADRQFLVCNRELDAGFTSTTHYMDFADMRNVQAMRLVGSFAACGGTDISITLPGGVSAATVQTYFGMCSRHFDIYDGQQQLIMVMRDGAFSGGNYVVTMPDGQGKDLEVAKFYRMGGMFDSQRLFGLNFTARLPSLHKAILIATSSFLVSWFLTSSS